MPFIYAGLRLIPGKFDKIKLHDVNYENTTGGNLKTLILSELEKKGEGVSSNETEIKEKKFKGDRDTYSSEFSPQEIDLVYCGKVLNDETPINSFNIKDYSMVHVFAKQRFVLGKSKEKTVAPEVVKPLDTTYINSLVFQFQRLTCTPSFGKAVLKKLKKPENMKKILSACPSLKNDPVALAIIKDPELLLQINNVETITKIATNHPSLARCVSDLVDILFEEIYNSLTPPSGASNQSTGASANISSPYLSGEEDMDLSPPVSDAAPTGASVITAAQVAAALQSTAGSGSVPQSPAITPEYVNSTMMQIMSNLSTPGTASSSSASTSVTSPAANPVNPIEQYASQIQQMRELGVTDEVAMIEALQLTNGDVQAALNLVFGL